MSRKLTDVACEVTENLRGHKQFRYKCGTAFPSDREGTTDHSSWLLFHSGKDLAGRTLLHNAVLYQHPEICKFLVEQFPHLINQGDSVSAGHAGNPERELWVCVKLDALNETKGLESLTMNLSASELL